MEIRNHMIFEKANLELKKLYGENALFREGQYEAIESVFLNMRTLVVQRTGWGKSLVYFIATKLMREKNNGPTIVISPLLVLMDNQIEMANKLGLKAIALNSKSDKDKIIEQWKLNALDIIFITPETLFSNQIQAEINNLKMGLFVIDEAHCISDWGHDFRLEYLRLSEIIKILPFNVPVLATTATATNRVINDLKSQLGENIYISRGHLSRKSLNIQVIAFQEKSEKYAWILENINKINGSGIIYCLTKWDCEKLADFLNENGIRAVAYHSGRSNEDNAQAESDFSKNNIKVIVATVKLGMGYDKNDISFVIHLQMSPNIVAYYQQIGRAGRGIDNAYVFLLKSLEDEKIIDYFIETAFPSEYEEKTVYNLIENHSGIKKADIYNNINLKKAKIDKALSFLENDKFIFKVDSAYYTTPKQFTYDSKHYEEITKIRLEEKNKMIEFTNTKECFSKYRVNALDDNVKEDCGKCSNCIGRDLIPMTISNESLNIARKYLLNSVYEIIPRKKLNCKNLEYINETGVCLSKYGDYGYGKMVAYDKYKASSYREEIIKRAVSIIKEQFIDRFNIEYITFVPSLRDNKVEILAQEIAKRLNLKCLDLLKKENSPQQKEMENSYYQSKNAMESYKSKHDFINVDKIILIDDIVDSKWTLTWCGYYLKENGIKEVYPFVLSDSSDRKEN